mgnify:CR=1 FL=1
MELMVVDAFNSNSEEYKKADYSYFEYYKLNATVTAEVMNKSFNYNENDVSLSLRLNRLIQTLRNLK